MKPSELSIDTRNYLLNRIFPKLISFLSLPILLRLVNPRFWGEIALLVAIQSLLTGLLSQGKDSSVERYFSRLSKKDATKYSRSYLAKTFFLFFLGLLIIEIAFRLKVVTFFDLPYGLPLRFALIGSLLLSHQRYLYAILRASRKSKKVLKYTQSVALATPLIQIGAIYLVIYFRDFNDRMIVSGYFLGQILILTITNVLIYIYVKKNTKEKETILELGTKNIRSYSNYAFLFIFLSTFINWQDRYFIKYFMSEYDVGLYDAIYRYVDILGVITGSFMIALGPILFSKKDLSNRYFENIQDLIYLTFLLAACGTYISSIAVGILLPESYSSAAYIVPVLALGLSFASCASLITIIFDVKERKDLSVKGILFASVINAALNVLLIPRYDILGAALSMLFSCIFWFILMLLFAHNFNFHMKKNILNIAFLISIIIIYFVFWEQTLLYNLLSIVIFVALLYKCWRLIQRILQFSL